jgi:YihY family inner membrane protein
MAVAVWRKFVDDRASMHAALIAYYAFLSLFPLLLALVSVLGLVAESHPDLPAEVLDTALGRIPVLGHQLEDDVTSLTGSPVALAVGLAGALWAGLGVTVAAGRALDDIWSVPRHEQPGFLRRRARGMATLGVIAAVLLVASVLPGLALGGAIGPLAQRLFTLAGALALNAAVFLCVFGLLGQRPHAWRKLLPGVALATAGSLALQAAGGLYVDRVVLGASEIYGSFALVIGLLSWFLLGAHLLLLAAETNVVIVRRLWPRSLSGELSPADRRALADAVCAARLDERLGVATSFGMPPDGPDGPDEPPAR